MWLSKLLGFDCEIIYRKGAENSVADALSRRFEDSHFHAISSPIFSHLTDIKKEYKADPALSLLIDCLQSSQSVLNYSYDGSILRYKSQIVIPSSSPLAILDRGIFKRNNRPATKLLVQWQGQSKEEATWEECSEFAARFPSFQLADKLPS
ncbi:hypothetical protein WN943_026159 [Citrus x changshan-huyou]